MTITNLYSASSNPALYVGVPQACYSITSADTKKPILFTCYATTCTVVTFCDAQRKIGAVAHFDSLTDVSSSVEEIANEFLNLRITLENMKIEIYGGLIASDKIKRADKEVVEESEKTVVAVEKALREKFVNITSVTFQKRLLTQKEEFKICQYHQKLEELDSKTGTSEEKHQQRKTMINKIDHLLSQSCYTQVCLNVETGITEATSQFYYLIEREDPLYNLTFSEKAQQHDREMVRWALDVMYNGKPANFKPWQLERI